MGYRHINNLYKDQTILMFKRLYAMEKIHGTSAHIDFIFNDYYIHQLKYYSGGEKYENFIKLFDEQKLIELANSMPFKCAFTVYGEAYGGKQQGMSATYGKDLKFVAFEVMIGDKFVKVPTAHEICQKLNLEFVHYEEIDADPELIDKLANAPSIQAIRNGVENPALPREGVVLRPLKELLHPDGIGRIMAKHKNDIYKEREHQPRLKDPEELKVLENAKQIVDEWVTPMRLTHVVDKLEAEGLIIEEKSMQFIIKAMIEDVYREAKNEIVESKLVSKAIGKKTAKLVIEYLKSQVGN